MIQSLKNIGVGFLVSFIGSIPLGYLNVIGFHIYEKLGLSATALFVLGVIIIEFFVILGTLVFAKKLAANVKLTKYIEGFSVVFMFLLAYVFYASAAVKNGVPPTLNYSPLLFGIVSSCLNFIQLPFWTGWNLWLLNESYIEVSHNKKYSYIMGTLCGTFCGMLALIFALDYFALNVDFLSKYLVKYIIPLVFLGFGIFQSVKFYRKYSH